MFDDLMAKPTEYGAVLLTIDEYKFELSIELAEKLKAQIEAALITARIRAKNKPQPSPR